MSMETKTRKAEALALLALLDKGDELTDKESYRLTYLTIEQGYPIIRETPGELEKFREHHQWYHISAEHSRNLPLPEGWYWMLRTPVQTMAEIYNTDGLRQVKMFARYLPVAMLKCWWALQE